MSSASRQLDLLTVTCTAANTEYALPLPQGTKQFTIFTNSATAALRVGYSQGKVQPGTTGEFIAIASGNQYYETDLDLRGQTLYVSSNEAATVVQCTIGT